MTAAAPRFNSPYPTSCPFKAYVARDYCAMELVLNLVVSDGLMIWRPVTRSGHKLVKNQKSIYRTNGLIISSRMYSIALCLYTAYHTIHNTLPCSSGANLLL